MVQVVHLPERIHVTHKLAQLGLKRRVDRDALAQHRDRPAVNERLAVGFFKNSTLGWVCDKHILGSGREVDQRARIARLKHRVTRQRVGACCIRDGALADFPLIARLQGNCVVSHVAITDGTEVLVPSGG